MRSPSLPNTFSDSFLGRTERKRPAYLYRHLLGRQLDPEGQRAHAQTLANSGPAPVIDTFVDSPEYRQSFGEDTVPGRRVRYCDTNNNGRIEGYECQGSRDAFGWLDRNNDNVLSRAEVVGQGRTAVDRFTDLDVNRDGRLSFDEWNWSRQSFDRRDANQEGVASRREFMASIR